jgi:formylglycine-generating enzyme required for sulfatase activity
MIHKAFTCIMTMLAMATCMANNIQVVNVSLVDEDLVEQHVRVRFNISWENSWRTSSAPNNWDAAWVFVKYLDASTGLWWHARLHSDAGHNAPAGSTIATGLLQPAASFDPNVNYGVGVFIHRSADGSGTFTANNVELRWNYGENGVAFEDISQVKVFAVEMVCVPEGAFWLGTGGTELSAFYQAPNTTTPYLIYSEDEITVGTDPGNLYWTAGVNSGDQSGPIPGAFPKGSVAFYLMKYLISQQQYVDFLNTLTREQQNTRTMTDLSVGVTTVTDRYVMWTSLTPLYRNGIRCDAFIDPNAPIQFYCDLNGNDIGGEFDDGQWIAGNHLGWADVAAYLDWSGLRPMTELEYEKACRGPVTPIPGEFSWGTTTIHVGNYTSLAPGTINETVADPGIGGNGNAVYGAAKIEIAGSPVNAPGRVGMFAGPGTDRVSAGAAYYGAMEMSGTLWDRAITVGNPAGRGFTGTLGDGILDGTGNANVVSWPGTNALGAGLQGGGLFASPEGLRVSARGASAFGGAGRGEDVGGRGCRQAP